MPLGAIWNAITGMFSSDTLVQDFIKDYERLCDRLDDTIRDLVNQRDDLRFNRVDFRERLMEYTDATGEVSTVYYDVVGTNEEEFRTTHAELKEALAQLRARKSDANSKLEQLHTLHQIEINQERAFTHSEINVRLY